MIDYNSTEIKLLAQMMYNPSVITTFKKEVSREDFRKKVFFEIYIGIVNFLIDDIEPTYADLKVKFNSNMLTLDIIDSMQKEEKVNDVQSLYDLLLNESQKEKLRELANKIHEQYDEDVDTKDIIANAESSLLNLVSNNGIQLSSIGQVGQRVMLKIKENIKRYHEKNELNPEMATGLDILDKYTLGFQRGTSWILAASTSDGKTMLSIQLANSVARQGKTVLYFTLEDTEDNLVNRLLSLRTGIKIHNILSGKLSSSEETTINNTINNLRHENKIMIDDECSDVGDIISKIKFASLKYPDLSLIIVDYINLASDRSLVRFNKEQEIASISKKLVKLAKKCNICVLILQQLNTNPDDRIKGMPIRITDLRDSKSPGFDASTVIGIHFPYKFKKNADGNYSRVECNLWIMKNRYGEVSRKIPLTSKADVCKFEEN